MHCAFAQGGCAWLCRDFTYNSIAFRASRGCHSSPTITNCVCGVITMHMLFQKAFKVQTKFASGEIQIDRNKKGTKMANQWVTV